MPQPLPTVDSVAFLHRHVEQIAVQAERLRSVVHDHQGAEARKTGRQTRRVPS